MRQSKMLSPGARVWLYARHSPGKNQSISAQLGALRDFCAYNGLVIADEFIDAGASGDNRSRAGLTRMVQQVEASAVALVDGLICYDASRLARDDDAAEYIKALLRYRGYVIEFLDQEYPDGVAGRVVEVIDDYEHSKFLARLRQKTKDGLRDLLKCKDAHGNYLAVWPMKPPWGFRAVKKELPIINTVTGEARVKQCLVPDPELFEFGRRLYTMRGADGLTYRQIEERTGFMAGKGTDVGTRERLGRYYLMFFSNPIYKGELRYQEITLPGYVPPMVSRELWDAANRANVTHRRGNWPGHRCARTGSAGPAFSLAGLIECAYCGSPHHTVTAGKNYHYYKCANRVRIGVAACPPSRPIRAEILEAAVIDCTLANFLADDFIGELTELVNALLGSVPNNDAQIARLAREIAELDRRIDNLIDDLELGRKVKDRICGLQEQLRAKEEERSRLEREAPPILTISPADVAGIFGELRRRLEDFEPKAVFHQIIDYITVACDKVTVYYKMPLGLADICRTLSVDDLQLSYVILLPVKQSANLDLVN